MSQDNPGISSNFKKPVHPEQFDQVVEAILAGKYSWACVLMLRFAGYNPLHYIPYRTYNRLLKDNSPEKPNKHQNNTGAAPASENSHNNIPSSCLSKIKDLAYMEVVGKQKREIRGGNLDEWLSTQMHENLSNKSESQQDSQNSCHLKLCEFN
ncbi:heterocyst differentiation protein HetP [Calothrix sp. NIES-4071]|nr:heterocyst differentiation protein HetP [Calothrix sp. NIES-4071]BAZ59115.1 heterocyst differentiation protein HetP [Calothrix sp. NIES-4105]